MTQYCLPLLLISSFAAVLARLNMIGCSPWWYVYTIVDLTTHYFLPIILLFLFPL